MSHKIIDAVRLLLKFKLRKYTGKFEHVEFLYKFNFIII